MRDEGRSSQSEGELKMGDNEWKVLKCDKDCSGWERREVSDFVVCVSAHRIDNCILEVMSYL